MKLVLVNNNQEKEVDVILSIKLNNSLYYLYKYNNINYYLGRKDKEDLYHLNDLEYNELIDIINKLNIMGDLNE